MLSNYYTLRCVVSTLQPLLSGTILAGMFTQEKDELMLNFEGVEPTLVLSCRGDASTCYLHGHTARARRNSVDIMQECVGARVTDISLHVTDRIVRIGFDDGRTLHARFFGPHSNVLLVDNGVIVNAFKQSKILRGKNNDEPGGELVYDFAAFRESLGSAPAALAATLLRRAFPTLGSTLAREVLCRAQIPYTATAATIAGSSLASLEQSLRAILADLEHPAARIYEQRGEPEIFAIIPLLQAASLQERAFENVHEAIRYFLGRRRSTARASDRKAAVIGTLRQQVEKARRTEAAVAAESAVGTRADEYEQTGTLLMSSLASLHKGLKSVELDGARIALDPKLTPVQNAQKYFEKAKHSRLAARQGTARLASLRERIVQGTTLVSALEEITTDEEVKQFMDEHAGELEEFGIGRKSEERQQLPFRIFTVEGGFEVWAGKSSENNDLLTLHHAKPNDLWFHARGSSGSHVVLKVGTGKGEPGKKAREQAAGIAAYYSKMKNAKMVPVAMTERKYVRKPKGAPPGTVTLEREKVIFAEPGLPEEKQRKVQP